MAHKLIELRGMSDEDLVREHDEMAQHTIMGLNYYRDEIQRREIAAMNRRMERLTWSVSIMTAVILVLTALLLWRDLR